MKSFKKAEAMSRRLKMLVYGVSGCGKTVASLSFPNPVMVDSEKGSLFYGDKFDFHRLQTTSYEEVSEALDELLEDPEDFKTFIVDPYTLIDEDIGNKHLRRMRVRKNNPNYSLQPLDYKVIKEERKLLVSKLLNLDMNIIVTARSKPQYSDDDGDFMKVIGQMPDVPKDLPYMFDVVLELFIDENDGRKARVIKDRSNLLPKEFDYSYKSFIKYIGVEGLERGADVHIQQEAMSKSSERNFEVVLDGTTIKTAGITAEQLEKITDLIADKDEKDINHQLLEDYGVSSFLDLRKDEADFFIENLNQN